MRTISVLILLSVSVSAHHGSSAYDTDREITIAGTIKEWRWAQPHTWIHLSVRSADGAEEVWDGEGPPLTWAAGRGWSASTLRAGEHVSLVIYPSKREPRTGLVKSIRRASGELLPVSRPWLPRG